MINSVIGILNKAGSGFCQYALPMLIQSTVLILLLLAIDLLLRKRVRAVLRYCIWLLVFVKLILPPTLSLPTGVGYWYGDYLSADSPILQQVSITPVIEPAKAISHQDFAAATEPPNVQTPQPLPETAGPAELAVSSLTTITWQAAVFLLWLVGVLVLSILLIQRAWFVKALIAQSTTARGRLLDTLDQCRRQIGIRGNVELKLSKNMQSPAACGLARPIILIPTSLLEKLSREKLRAVLIHELAHIKRGDLWVNCAQTILQIIYFYNPFVWLAGSIVRRIREQAVDEMVLTKLGDEAKNYSNTLIDIAEIAFARPMLSLRLTGVVESKKTLKARIKHILTRPIPKTAKLGLAGLLAIIVAGAILLPMAKATPGPPEFVIKGAVTDAETGQPIAGAKVGDVDRYAEGKQWITTDANGNYSYKTWYEEHGIKAEATGYKMETTGLFTELFGSEKEKVIDFALTPEKASDSSEFKATLPNGVTVELVGVCEHPSEDKQWWRPDGSIIEKSLYETTGGGVSVSQEGYAEYEFAGRVSGISDFDIKWDVPGGTKGTHTGSPIANDGSRVRSLDAHTVNQPQNKKQAIVRIGVASGSWDMSMNIKAIKSAIMSIDDIEVGFAEPYEKAGITYVPVTYLKGDFKNKTVALVAVDKNKNERSGSYSGSGGNKLSVGTYSFRLPFEEIEQFRFKSRPYEWVEFKNVSLRPGYKTAIQVEIAAPLKAKKVDYSSVVVEEGVGFGDIIVGDFNCTKEFIKSRLGLPDEDLKDTETNGWWLNYIEKYGLDFWLNEKGILREIRLNKTFKGNLTSGISMSSTKEDVFGVYGKPVSEQVVDNLTKHFENQVLYKSVKPLLSLGGKRYSKIFYNQRWLLFWFEGEKVKQIVVYPKTDKTAVQVEVEAASEVSDVDKRASEDLAADGWQLWRERKLTEAEEAFKRAVEKDPTSANAWNGLGWSQSNQGKALNAKVSFEKCLEIDPKHPAALNGLGWIAKGQGKTEGAIGHWEKAVEAAPTATAALSGLGQTYMELKEYDKAAKYYQMWLNVEPNNAQAKSGLEKAKSQQATPRMGLKERLQNLVEEFFQHNYRDITARKTIEWGDPVAGENGNMSIRYKYEATIWGKEKIIQNKVFTFDKKGSFISAEDVDSSAGRVQGEQRADKQREPKSLQVYEVNRSVADFSEKEDFSTPEAAYAAINRISDQGDNAAWARVSVKELAKRFRQAKPGKTKADPEWSNVLQNAHILEVRIWNGNYAMVAAELHQKFSSKTIRSPIDVRHLELENGRWLNSGNDRVWAVEDAGAIFNRVIRRVSSEQRSKYQAQLNLSSPEETVISFTKAAAAGNVELALACFAPDSHDYEDTKAILIGPASHPIKMLFDSIDTDKPITVVKTDMTDDRCSIVWRFSLKHKFTVEGQTFQPGDTFDLDGNLRKIDDNWLIVGI